MTKKSIGEFIAALRKANGMTQKQLAEILNVSDKSVSRWERDESAPDISLIPVIADVFDVTCDEILRGEKRASDSITTKPSKVHLDYILKQSKTKFKILSYTACGLGLLAILLAILINFSLTKSFIAFIVGCIVLLIAVICEVICIVTTRSSLDTKEIDSQVLFPTKSSLYLISKRTFIFLGLIFGILLPLLSHYIYINHYNENFIIDTGIQFSSWLGSSILFVRIIVIISIIVTLILDRNFQKANQEFLYENQLNYGNKIRKMTVKVLIILAGLLIITTCSRKLFYQLTTEFTFIEGTTFTDLREFEDYMETISYNYYSPYQYSKDDKYFDNLMNGDITSPSGEVVSTFSYNNKKVIGLDVKWDGNTPQVTAYTVDDYMEAATQRREMGVIWDYAYVIELMIVICLYLIKRNRLKKHFL